MVSNHSNINRNNYCIYAFGTQSQYYVFQLNFLTWNRNRRVDSRDERMKRIWLK